MTLAASKPGWRFGIVWTLAMAIAWIAGGYVGFIVGDKIATAFFFGTFSLVGLILAVLLYGSILAGFVSFLQCFFLQLRIDLNSRWIIQSMMAGGLGQMIGIAGLLISALLLQIIVFWFPFTDSFISRLHSLGILITLLGLGASVGRVQYSILKLYVARPHEWIWANVIGWPLSILIQIYGAPLIIPPPPPPNLTFGSPLSGLARFPEWPEDLVGGCVFGVITGICMICLLRSTQRPESG